MLDIDNPVCVALDTTDLTHTCQLAGALRGGAGMVKLGMEFFYAHGRDGYEAVGSQGLPVFLDLKLCDIPNTMVKGLGSLMQMIPRPKITTIHASAGPSAMRHCARAMSQLEGPACQLIAVTVMTSLDDGDLLAIGFDTTLDVRGHVLAQAKLAQDCGADGVVCSPLDIAGIKQACGHDFVTVVPGLRPAGISADDQKRIATPETARAAGADVLVIGRPITQATDPARAAHEIAAGVSVPA